MARYLEKERILKQLENDRKNAEIAGNPIINFFRNEYEFLSNMYESPIQYGGFTYRNAEAAFQAQKTIVHDALFENMIGIAAKKHGRKVALRPDWEKIKLDVMYKVVYEKFNQDKNLKAMLIKTGNTELIEGNFWGDTFWGICDGVGENNLGKILMRVRKELS